MAGYRKLGRTSSQRKALLRNQVTNLLYHGKIVTTESKAKEIRKVVSNGVLTFELDRIGFQKIIPQMTLFLGHLLAPRL